jgi:hypothetical protein
MVEQKDDVRWREVLHGAALSAVFSGPGIIHHLSALTALKRNAGIDVAAERASLTRIA